MSSEDAAEQAPVATEDECGGKAEGELKVKKRSSKRISKRKTPRDEGDAEEKKKHKRSPISQEVMVTEDKRKKAKKKKKKTKKSDPDDAASTGSPRDDEQEGEEDVDEKQQEETTTPSSEEHDASASPVASEPVSDVAATTAAVGDADEVERASTSGGNDEVLPVSPVKGIAAGLASRIASAEQGKRTSMMRNYDSIYTVKKKKEPEFEMESRFKFYTLASLPPPPPFVGGVKEYATLGEGSYIDFDATRERWRQMWDD